MKKGKEITEVAEEAAKIMKDYPDLKYYQAIKLAEEALKYGEKYRNKNSNRKRNTRNNH